MKKSQQALFLYRNSREQGLQFIKDNWAEPPMLGLDVLYDAIPVKSLPVKGFDAVKLFIGILEQCIVDHVSPNDHVDPDAQQDMFETTSHEDYDSDPFEFLTSEGFIVWCDGLGVCPDLVVDVVKFDIDVMRSY